MKARLTARQACDKIVKLLEKNDCTYLASTPPRRVYQSASNNEVKRIYALAKEGSK